MDPSRTADATRHSPVVIAHRGASLLAPENTLAAYISAVELQVDVVELDVQMTRDGTLVCIHDETVDRTTNATGKVSSLDIGDIQRLDASSWFYGSAVAVHWDPSLLRVPTLDEAVRVVRGRCRLAVELKSPALYPGLEERVVETLQRLRMLGDGEGDQAVFFLSFDPDSLKRVAALAPHVPRVQVFMPDVAISAHLIEEVSGYASGIGPYYATVTPSVVNQIHAAGLLIFPWVVNRLHDMRALVQSGVDGIVSDHVVALKRVVQERDDMVNDPDSP